MGNNKIIGAKIKSIRESKQLSTQEVSERSGLSIEQIERIEGNIDFPSLAPLIKIARVLGVRLGTFLDDQSELGPVICRKKDSNDTNSIGFSNNDSKARKRFLTVEKSKVMKMGTAIWLIQQNKKPWFCFSIQSANCRP